MANIAIAGIAALIPKPKSAEGFLKDVTGIDTTDQCSRLASPLSVCAVNTWVPSGRSLGAIVTGTSNNGAKFCRT